MILISYDVVRDNMIPQMSSPTTAKPQMSPKPTSKLNQKMHTVAYHWI